MTIDPQRPDEVYEDWEHRGGWDFLGLEIDAKIEEIKRIGIKNVRGTKLYKILLALRRQYLRHDGDQRFLAKLEAITGWKEFALEDLLACRPQVQVANEKKRQLLAMPPGSPKPTPKTHLLGNVLENYTSPSSKNKCYDPIFDKEIRKKQPEWFVGRFDRIKQDKRELLAMPIGSPKPARFYDFLRACTAPGSERYDSDFDKAIRERQPDWFVRWSAQAKRVAKQKEELLAMPVGSPRPDEKHPLGNVLENYTNPKTNPRKDCYDPSFDKAIREKHPDWFIGKAARNKKELLAMPVGSPRPGTGYRLGGALAYIYCTSMNPESKDYDPGFNKAIREKHPDWFLRGRPPADLRRRRQSYEAA